MQHNITGIMNKSPSNPRNYCTISYIKNSDKGRSYEKQSNDIRKAEEGRPRQASTDASRGTGAEVDGRAKV
jgi:hypothetical protein